MVTQRRKLVLNLAGGLQKECRQKCIKSKIPKVESGNQGDSTYSGESSHRRREAWDGHGGERSDAVGGILVWGSSNVVGRLGEVG